MLRDVWRTVESSPGARPILATSRKGVFPICVPDGDVWLQGEGDLGERIERILTRGLQESAAVMAIGADAPALSVAHVEAGIECLATHDAVLGPATDGGFYLLGLRRCPRGLFTGLSWSTGETNQALQARLVEHGFSIVELEPLFDVDLPADLLTLGRYLDADSSLQSATREWWVEIHANQHHRSRFERSGVYRANT